MQTQRYGDLVPGQDKRNENLSSRLKNWRRIATRYDRLARNYLAAPALVAIASAWAE